MLVEVLCDLDIRHVVVWADQPSLRDVEDLWHSLSNDGVVREWFTATVRDVVDCRLAREHAQRGADNVIEAMLVSLAGDVNLKVSTRRY